ncbi:PASTA domain-containing protein [Kribbella sp. CA-294648]|uniref:PASTA domain-containing protein n=1 Tax=Kribbella sp. CA-294648 TaxID=3239948 RepID=UPI003D8DF477
MKLVWCAPLLLFVVGCAGDQSGQQPTVTVTAPAADPTTPQQTSPTPPEPPEPTVAPPPTTALPTKSRPPSAPGTARSAVVPAVVGVNHQLAQDTMQAAGFYYLLEEDATGQGRLLINDRNWVVVSQSPAGGTTAPVDAKIVLRSKKIGE